jgi:hypothetical protein
MPPGRKRCRDGWLDKRQALGICVVSAGTRSVDETAGTVYVLCGQRMTAWLPYASGWVVGGGLKELRRLAGSIVGRDTRCMNDFIPMRRIMTCPQVCVGTPVLTPLASNYCGRYRVLAHDPFPTASLQVLRPRAGRPLSILHWTGYLSSCPSMAPTIPCH